MGYLPFRDNPALGDITDQQRMQIGLLADSLELAARQSYHDNGYCYCEEGRNRGFWRCPNGAVFATVETEEILALLVAQGRLTQAGLDWLTPADQMQEAQCTAAD